MENKKEKTAPDVSVGADTEQPTSKNTTSSISENGGNIKSFEELRLRKFTFGNNGVESTHDALIKYQAMTFGFNITLFCIRSKPSFSSGQTPAYSSWLCF